jgi:hypothetical protein
MAASIFILSPAPSKAKSYSFPKAYHVQSSNLKLTSLATDQRELARKHSTYQFLNILKLAACQR